MKKWKSQITDIDARIQIITSTLSGEKQKNAKSRIESLRSEVNSMARRQKALAVGFIRPRQMVDVLKGLLETEKGLQLTRLQSQAVEPLIHPEAQPSSSVTATAASALAKAAVKKGTKTKTADSDKPSEQVNRGKTPQVYKHGLEIVFQGDYQSTLSYLKKLEELPWKFYWDQVDYEVIDYPKAQITVRIHTLSLDKSWISV